MNNIMLFAGESTDSLKSFLEARGSVNVVHHYNNLFANEPALKNKLHSADKIVYIYQDESMNVRQDMRVLKSLFISDSFFKAENILFLLVETSDYENISKYIKTTITEISDAADRDKSLTSPSCHISTSEEQFTYDMIYREILGTSEGNKVSNTRKKLYRVERGSESKSAYEPGNFQNQSALPYNTERLDRYNSLTLQALKADAGQAILDSADRPVGDKTDPEFERLNFIDIAQKHQIILGCGIPKSGTTTFLTALGVSFSSIGQRSLLIDCTKQRSWRYVLDSHDLIYESVDTKCLLLDSRLTQSQSLALLYEFEHAVRFNLLANIVANINRLDTKVLIIDLDVEDLQRANKIFNSFNTHTFVSTTSLESDIDFLSEPTSELKRVSVLLSNTVPYNDKVVGLPPDEIKRRINVLSVPSSKLYKPILLENMELDDTLVSTMLGVS